MATLRQFAAKNCNFPSAPRQITLPTLRPDQALGMKDSILIAQRQHWQRAWTGTHLLLDPCSTHWTLDRPILGYVLILLASGDM